MYRNNDDSTADRPNLDAACVRRAWSPAASCHRLRGYAADLTTRTRNLGLKNQCLSHTAKDQLTARGSAAGTDDQKVCIGFLGQVEDRRCHVVLCGWPDEAATGPRLRRCRRRLTRFRPERLVDKRPRCPDRGTQRRGARQGRYHTKGSARFRGREAGATGRLEQHL
jgi:hypothetical protein